MSNDNDGHREQPVGQPSPDLTYLHPDNLHVGSVGVFAGDWAWTGNPPRIPVGFVGVLIDWNGWAVWRCTREVAEAVAADQQRMRELERARLAEGGLSGAELDRRVDEALARGDFDGDDLVLDETAQHGEPSFERQGPGRDDRYCPMGFNWTWQAAADCDRIAGVLPAFGEHRTYVMATHEPLRMPHDRLTITALNATTTDYGTTSTALLSFDDEPVGRVLQRPSQPPQFRPADSRFGHEQLEEFVRACRWRGRPVDTPTALQALIAEYEPASHIVAAEDQGFATVILRDGDDHIVGTDIFLEPRLFAPGDRQTLADLFTGPEVARRPHQNQFVWQIWTGRRWQMLGIVDMPRDGAAAGHEAPGADQTPTITSSGQPNATPPELLPGDGESEAGGPEQNGQDQ